MKTNKIIKQYKSSEQTISMILGIAVVAVVGILLFNYFRSLSQKTKVPPEEGLKITPSEEITEKESKASVSLPAKYTVQNGDYLWKISLKFYGSGFNWIDIAKENKIKSPNYIEIGQQLTIPNVRVRKPIAEQKTSDSSISGIDEVSTIKGEVYNVVKGDNLWKISVRAYQDGYKWPQIAKANQMVNPSLIHPGNILTIPR